MTSQPAVAQEFYIVHGPTVGPIMSDGEFHQVLKRPDTRQLFVTGVQLSRADNRTCGVRIPVKNLDTGNVPEPLSYSLCGDAGAIEEAEANVPDGYFVTGLATCENLKGRVEGVRLFSTPGACVLGESGPVQQDVDPAKSTVDTAGSLTGQTKVTSCVADQADAKFGVCVNGWRPAVICGGGKVVTGVGIAIGVSGSGSTNVAYIDDVGLFCKTLRRTVGLN